MKRSGPLVRKSSMKRGGRLNPVSRRRRKRDAHYAEQRVKAYDRAGGVCEFREPVWQITARCGQPPTDVHHVAGRGGPDPHRLTNLVVLCRSHHDFVHANPAEAFRLGLLRHRNGTAVHDEGGGASELYLPGIDFPTVTKPDESADVRRTRKRRALLDAGVHPLTMLPLAGNGETCGTCAHHYPTRHRSKVYHKCDLTPQTHGPGTDLRISWPACERWEAVPS